MGEIERKAESGVVPTAEQINAEHWACEEAAQNSIQHAIRCGEMLEEKKSSLKHGEWGPWLEANFDGSDRTARTYMKVASNKGELSNRQRASDLSIRGALRELSAPEEEIVEELAGPKPDGMKPGYGGSVKVLFLREMVEDGKTDEAARKAGLTEGQVRWWAGRSLSTEQISADIRSLHRWNIERFRQGREPDAGPNIDLIERNIRPVDLQPSVSRTDLEENLSYKDMHRTFGELVEERKLLPNDAEQPLRDQILRNAIFCAYYSIPDGGTDEEVGSVRLAMLEYAKGGGNRTVEEMLDAGIIRAEEIRQESYPNSEAPKVYRVEHSSEIDLKERENLRYMLAVVTSVRTAAWTFKGYDAWLERQEGVSA